MGATDNGKGCSLCKLIVTRRAKGILKETGKDTGYAGCLKNVYEMFVVFGGVVYVAVGRCIDQDLLQFEI